MQAYFLKSKISLWPVSYMFIFFTSPPVYVGGVWMDRWRNIYETPSKKDDVLFGPLSQFLQGYLIYCHINQTPPLMTHGEMSLLLVFTGQSTLVDRLKTKEKPWLSVCISWVQQSQVNTRQIKM